MISQEQKRVYNKEYLAEWRKRNPDYMNKWRKDNPGKVKKWVEANKGKCRTAEKKYEKANAYKRRAKCKVYYAIKTGKLKSKPCQICGKQKADAHHEDYSKPLEVIWLCRAHHKRIHTMGMEECKLKRLKI